MNNSGTVNDVITDSVTQANTLLMGLSAPQGMAVLDMVSAETLGMTMYNAMNAQQNAQITSNASTTTACAKMLAMSPPSPESPAKPVPPPFMPLSGQGGDGNINPDDLIKMAENLAENAIKQSQKDGSASAGTQKAITDLIAKLNSLAGSSTPSPSASPSPSPSASPTPAPAPAPSPTPSASDDGS